MPHIIVEKNARGLRGGRVLVEALHAEAVTFDALPTGGIRTRLIKPAHSSVGADHGDESYCYVTVRLGRGRSDAVKREIGDRLFKVLTDWAAPAVRKGQPVSLGLEIQEIDPDWTWKQNNIHALLKAQDAQDD